MRASSRKVEIVDYDPAWPQVYNQERRRILRAIPHLEVRVEHVGSTAVPKLAAKPIVDILIGVPRLCNAVDCIPRLAALGYRYVPGVEVAMPYRRFLRKARNGRRTHHVHILEHAHQAWLNHILFRDYLRTHPKVAREYERLKRRLAWRYRFDIAAYAQGKTEFVHATLVQARRERERRKGPRHSQDTNRNRNTSLVRPPVTYETVLHAISQVI